MTAIVLPRDLSKTTNQNFVAPSSPTDEFQLDLESIRVGPGE
jgi:hypothetical protein